MGIEYSLDEKNSRVMENFENNRGHRLKTLIGLYKGQYHRLILSIIFFAIKHSPVWVLPVATSNIINQATNPSEDSTQIIFINVIIMILLVVQNIISNYFHTYLYAKTIRNVERDLRSALVHKLQKISISTYNKMQSGRVQSKIIRDVEQIETLSSQIFISVLSIIMNISVAFVIVVVKSRVVFLFFIGTIPVAVTVMTIFKKRIKRYNQEFRKEMEETSVSVMEMVNLVPVTRAHALEKKEINKMDKQLSNVAEKGLKLDILQSYFSSISWVVFQCFQVVCLGFTGYLATKGRISVGEVVLYQTYFATIVSQVSGIITLLPTIAKGLESVSSIADILLVENVENNEGKCDINNLKGNITFENVDFSYGENKILQNVNLSIRSGETVAFVGSSGAGKTTIINLVIGFIKAGKGKVMIDGYNINDLNLQTYRSHISLVPQNSVIFSDTVKENIIYGLDNVSNDKVNEAVSAANLSDVIENLPKGVDTRIAENGNDLSGGQKQRISIARAFVREPNILLLDEATSALDTISEKKIQESIRRIIKNKTTLIVAHRLSTIRDADKIVVMDNGGIAEIGTYDELMEKKGKFYKLQSLQV